MVIGMHRNICRFAGQYRHDARTGDQRQRHGQCGDEYQGKISHSCGSGSGFSIQVVTAEPGACAHTGWPGIHASAAGVDCG